MKLILISDFEKCANPKLINELFELGLYRFHIREKQLDNEKITSFLDGIEVNWKPKISFHGEGFQFGIDSHNSNKSGKSESCHSLKEIEESDKEYCFLSPVFDSISKENYPSKFELNEVSEALKSMPKKSVFALGGIDDFNIKSLLNTGFEGVALKGFIWNKGNDPKEQFLKISEAIQIEK